MQHKWGALISQTGKELFDICTDLGIRPNVIVSTKPIQDVNLDFRMFIEYHSINFIYLSLENSKNQILLYRYLHGCTIVTLHGWLRIIPKDICEIFDIYNGHPGDIVLYPQLKGFNPQEKAHSLGLATSGSVVHKVTPIVDDGPIIHRVITSIRNCDLDQTYDRLRTTSLLAWKLFFTRYFSVLPNKFAITGAHCTGKTTLVEAIREFDVNEKFQHITSMTRGAKALGYQINEAGNDETQLYILNTHLERLVINSPCVLDRSIIDGYTYTKILHELGNVSDVVMKYATSLLNVEYMNRYNKIFYLPPTLQLVSDGLRSTEPEFRRHVVNTFEDVIRSANLFLPDLVTVIDGSVEQRVKAVNKFLQI